MNWFEKLVIKYTDRFTAFLNKGKNGECLLIFCVAILICGIILFLGIFWKD